MSKKQIPNKKKRRIRILALSRTRILALIGFFLFFLLFIISSIVSIIFPNGVSG